MAWFCKTNKKLYNIVTSASPTLHISNSMPLITLVKLTYRLNFPPDLTILYKVLLNLR